MRELRIRSTKPEFWRSRRVASVSWDARLVLKGLESFVDDNGVGKHDVELIVGDLFQRDAIREPSRTFARVSEAISELNRAGLLWLYEANGEELVYIAFWEQVQRVDKAQPGRFPRPDGTINYKDSQILESVASIREPSRDFAPGTGEQGNRGSTYASQSPRAREIPDDRSSTRCDEHRGWPSPPPCNDCGDVRETTVDHTAAAAARRRDELDAVATMTRAEIDGCPMCDDRGYRSGRVCSHDPDEDDRRARGIAAARAELAGRGGAR